MPTHMSADLYATLRALASILGVDPATERSERRDDLLRHPHDAGAWADGFQHLGKFRSGGDYLHDVVQEGKPTGRVSAHGAATFLIRPTYPICS